MAEQPITSGDTPPIAGDELDARIAVEAVAHIYRQAHLTALAYFVMVSLLAVALMGHVPLMWLLGWLAASYLFLTYRLVLYFSFRRHGGDRPPAYWGRLYARSALYQGITWGVGAVLLFAHDSVGHQVMLISLVVAITVSYLALVPYWRSIFYGYALPANAGLAVSLLVRGEDYSLLALSVVAFTIIVSLYARRAGRTVRDALRLRFENAMLAEQLRREKDKAEEASRVKTQFLAAASHDLRQPVHTLSLLGEALRGEVATDRGGRLMDRLDEAIGSLTGLLSSLLDISRLDAGIVVPAPRAVSLAQLTDVLSNEFRKEAASKGLVLRRHGCTAILRTDPDLLADILRNLLANAIRYTDRGGVLLACRRRGDNLLIQVWDTGIGIPESSREAIFLEFHQLQNPERDRSKGLGLGLAICRRLAQVLGYRLQVASRPGRGSVFQLWLPSVLDLAEDPTAASAALPAPPGDFSQRRVLVIEDEASVREATINLLEGWGIEVLAAKGLAQAKALVAGRDIDLILADYRLRGKVTGSEAIRAIQALLGEPVPAVIVTGDTAAERVRDAHGSGFVLLHKPIRPGHLRAVLNQLLAPPSPAAVTD